MAPGLAQPPLLGVFQLTVACACSPGHGPSTRQPPGHDPEQVPNIRASKQEGNTGQASVQVAQRHSEPWLCLGSCWLFLGPGKGQSRMTTDYSLSEGARKASPGRDLCLLILHVQDFSLRALVTYWIELTHPDLFPPRDSQPNTLMRGCTPGTPSKTKQHTHLQIQKKKVFF